MTKPAKLPEAEYLAINHGCKVPENCCDDGLYLYCCACCCVDGLMRQQLANKEKTDPMSMDHGGWVASVYSDECFQWFFPCVLTEMCLEGFWSLCSGHSGNAAEKAIHKMEKRQLQAEVVTALVKEALPDVEGQEVRSKAQAIGPFGWLYYAGYVLKKNKQNRGVVLSQPFTTAFYHPPGTNDIEFLIR